MDTGKWSTLPFNQAEFGGIGLEKLLPMTLKLVKNEKLDLINAISLISLVSE